MNAREYHQLQAEVSTLQSMIERLPSHHAIERLSLESRKREVEGELSSGLESAPRTREGRPQPQPTDSGLLPPAAELSRTAAFQHTEDRSGSMVDAEHSATHVENPAIQEPEGLDTVGEQWGDYPIDNLLIRHENRTIFDVIRRIERGSYIMDPDFQRDLVWSDDKQSKLIESVIMRIPLPVFYLAEDEEGRMIVVDGLQRLSTFHRFVKGQLQLRLPDRSELDRLRFTELPPKLKNRIEDCNLICYIIDSKVPERARLDIFERVNSGEPLTRQQMRNSLFMGPATRLLKDESGTESFLKATGKSLNPKTMRDRELVNRFCAFRLLDLDEYRGDMDDFLAKSLRKMNRMSQDDLSHLSDDFRRSMSNNILLFQRHSFRKSILNWHETGDSDRSMINASIWDVLSTGLSRYDLVRVEKFAEHLRAAFCRLLQDEYFNAAITISTNETKRVKMRFQMADQMFKEVLGACPD